jgi:hypothetical protein
MTLPASGSSISLNQVNVELGLSGTTTITMNQTTLRTLFAVASGAISMSNGFSKSAVTAAVSSIAVSGSASTNPFTNGTWTVLITYTNSTTSTDCTKLTWAWYNGVVNTGTLTGWVLTVSTANVTGKNTAGAGTGYIKATDTSTGIYGSKVVSWTCLPLTTLITMSDGTQKEMSKIGVGDTIKAVNTETNELSDEKVTFVLDTIKSYNLIKIICEDNIIIEPTPEHEIWIKRDGITLWVESKTVIFGDELLADNLSYKKVISVEAINYPDGIEVGNISVANAKVYFAERLLMHNTG